MLTLKTELGFSTKTYSGISDLAMGVLCVLAFITPSTYSTITVLAVG